MKVYRLLVIIFLLSISQKVFNGFVAGTLVKVPDGYEAIENLVPGSIVYSFDAQGNTQISKVEKTFSYKSHLGQLYLSLKMRLLLQHFLKNTTS